MNKRGNGLGPIEQQAADAELKRAKEGLMNQQVLLGEAYLDSSPQKPILCMLSNAVNILEVIQEFF